MQEIQTLYKQKRYQEVINRINPDLDISQKIPPHLSFLYVWSLARLLLFAGDYPCSIDQPTLMKIEWFINSYMPEDNLLYEIIASKIYIYERYQESKAKEERKSIRYNRRVRNRFEPELTIDDYQHISYARCDNKKDYYDSLTADYDKGFDDSTYKEQGNYFRFSD